MAILFLLGVTIVSILCIGLCLLEGTFCYSFKILKKVKNDEIILLGIVFFPIVMIFGVFVAAKKGLGLKYFVAFIKYFC
jgi:hypothetical protein